MYQDNHENITLTDIAKALGVSITTVSRAISGKGRIGEGTRKKVLDYISEHPYRPNMVAKGFAQRKTYNICVVMPEDYDMMDFHFFQECLRGIQEVTESENYDVLFLVGQSGPEGSGNLSSLRRVVNHGKVDGVILMRTFLEDNRIAFLKETGFPFVTVGSTETEGVAQVDHDHRKACGELTEVLLRQGLKRLALLGEETNHVVTKNRYLGFQDGHRKAGRPWEKQLVFMGDSGEESLGKAVEQISEKGADCMICMDDAVCSMVLRKLGEMGKRVPEDIQVASFYDSSVLNRYGVSVTSIRFDARRLGMAAAKTLFHILDGGEPARRELLPYEICMGASTKNQETF